MKGKEWKELMRQAEHQGWRVSRTNGDHYKWLSPDGKNIVVTGSTVSDRRGMQNTIARLRKGGFR